ncbi:Peroxiredoxin [Owenweeksia hongkongensis DSM 17368]|uniref:Peroxiredoxin n=1 Tax=Owenweeksia hongkongensis (strain DSM 17368 / CIP 108786 / JCM 12287 / NRRL B-23963 / UST20020801) TaxID=926562 RepID=G8R6J3_OWEHD|nr:TlpA disulfide reductase family protein [Owenweeksia hongkongensis]AEV34456.1 Peroxiredoxin [Owenweeksia hongkongensis DSM 17368]
MRILKMMALAATATFAFSACESNSGTSIEGNLKGDEFTQVILYNITPQSINPFDTVAVVDNKFKVDVTVDTADFMLVQLSERFRIPLFVQPGEHVTIEIDDMEDMSYNISGSPESERIEKINEILLEANKAVQALNDEGQAAMQDSAQFEMIKPRLDSTFKQIVADTRKQYTDMIDENPGSLANIFIFSQSIGQMPLVTPQENFEYFEKVGEGISESYPNSIHTKSYNERMVEMRKNLAMQQEMDAVKQNLAPGAEVPEIALENLQGQVMKLSDLRGKVVLVDFWAAWCRPCRAENPNLVRMYNLYKDKGFEVYSVSLDGLPSQQDPKEAWAKAITVDQLAWNNHVSDLKGWQTSVIKDFGFQGIPYTVLVDREGKIIATELRGPALEAKLKEVL